jgi:hypothetical protein
MAQSPCLAVPRIRFLFIGSPFMFHASYPHSVALMQLRFASLVVINLRRDWHPKECAHAGGTQKKPPELGGFPVTLNSYQLGTLPSTPLT